MIYDELTELLRATELAEQAQKKALATRTKVGVCIVTTDGKFYQGANFENNLKKTFHAEETALIHALMDGKRKTDFKYMVQLAFGPNKVYPCCLSCLAYLYDYTHPDFKIYTIWKTEIKHIATLKELVKGFGDADVYPDKSRRF